MGIFVFPVDRQTSVVDSVPVPVPVETASQNVPSVSVAKPGDEGEIKYSYLICIFLYLKF